MKINDAYDYLIHLIACAMHKETLHIICGGAVIILAVAFASVLIVKKRKKKQ